MTDTNPLRRIMVIRDHKEKIQELWSDVFVAAGGDKSDERNFSDILVRSRCTKALSPEEADFVIFTGGPDVNPEYYGETKHSSCFVSDTRDAEDIQLYAKCLKLGIPMVGICRGAQFLHVMNGGKLYQHVDNHTGDHSMYDISKREMVTRVSSVHHQMVRSNTEGGMLILGDTRKSVKKYRNATDFESGPGLDIEAFYYSETACLGVQGHPEYKSYDEFASWFIDIVHDLFVLNPDIELRGKYRRVKPGVMDKQKLVHPAVASLYTDLN